MERSGMCYFTAEKRNISMKKIDKFLAKNIIA